jgi:hypothetical protein
MIARRKRAHVLFTDESPMELHPRPNRQNHRVRTEHRSTIPPVQRPKFGLKIMVAGGISAHGKSQLHIVPDKVNINGEYYRENIVPLYAQCINNRQCFPRRRIAILMQDGAPAHTAKLTISQIHNCIPSVWTDWPGNSPDFNPIEHIWALLQDGIFRAPRPKNRTELIARVTQDWEELPQAMIASLCDSFGRRLEECIKNKGHHTKY